MSRLGVVLITHNQAWNVDRLLASVAREIAPLDGAEVVLVDSASTDETVALATRHPIDVLRLQPDQPLTAAAGRHVGYRYGTADRVLFLDGDMELCPGWLAAAQAVLDDRPDVAVVSGEILDVPRRSPAPEPSSTAQAAIDTRTVPYTAGVALHRRAVLEAVGSFNPYLKSDEEPELCLRIRRAGHRIVQLGRPAVYHYADAPGALSTLLARRSRGLYLGAGQAIRHNLRTGLLWMYIRERGYGLVPGLVLGAGLAAFLGSATTGRWILFGVWTMLVAAVLCADVVRRRSLRRTAHSLLERLLILDGTIRGFIARPLEPASYPARYDVVQRGKRVT